MTPSQLKQATLEDYPYFFTRDTMKFFGDTMRNYGVCSSVINTRNEKEVEVWELFRKKPVKHNLGGSVYFRKRDFKKVSDI